jgi:ribosome maturation factor RimP
LVLSGRKGVAQVEVPFADITRAKVEVEFSPPSAAVLAVLGVEPTVEDEDDVEEEFEGELEDEDELEDADEGEVEDESTLPVGAANTEAVSTGEVTG